MKFQEALELKKSYPTNFKSERGGSIIFLVAPRDYNDLNNWLKSFNVNFTDETAKEYCNDNNYWVYWKEV